MPIIRKQLKPSDVYPDDIRYDADTDAVQRFVNGEWVDAPESDPRTHTTFPPRITSDPRCDAAQSVADALQSQIAPILTAIDNSATAFTIAGLILSIFTFGVYAIFIGLALGIGNVMLDAGSTAIGAALTDTAFETLRCILFCQMNDSGRLKPGRLGEVQTEVSDMIGGLGATILNAMLALAGEGGINNLAAIGTSTGDCSECGCLTPCADADSFYNGIVNSAVDNGNGTITFNVTSQPAPGDGTQYIGWGDRSNPDSPCCVFKHQSAFEGSTLGGARQACGSGTEVPIAPDENACYHFWLFYSNADLTTEFTCDITIGGDC